MISLAAVNLNLLVALDALLATQSVSQAAQRLGVTQSAMSHTLRQLRALFDDPLLVRSGRSMVPTPRAEGIARELQQALAQLEAVVARRGGFDPARYEGTFSIATQDGVAAMFAGELLPRLRREAPGASLHVRRVPADLPSALAEGRIDLATAPPIEVPSGLVQSPVPGTSTRWAVLCARDHPAESLDLDAFCRWPHAMMSLSGEGPSFVDHALARQGRQRRVAVRVPWLLALPHVLPGTDLLAVVVEPAARQFCAQGPLKAFPVPVELPRPPMTLLYHQRYAAEPSHRWFRERVADAMRAAAAAVA